MINFLTAMPFHKKAHILPALQSVLLLSPLLFSCTGEENQHELVSTHKKQKYEFGKTGHSTLSINDLLPIDGDTLVAAKGNGGIAITVDAGKTWQTLHSNSKKSDYILFNSLAYDNKNTLWGLYSWPGVHEAPVARLAYSNDFGKTWKWQKNDNQPSFPVDFYSTTGQSAELLTNNGNLYKIQHGESANWTFVKQVADLDIANSDTTQNDSKYKEIILAHAQYKFSNSGQVFSRIDNRWKLITQIGFVDRVSDVCPCDSGLYVTAHKDAVSPSPYYLLRIANGRVESIIIAGEGENRLRCDNKQRLWLFNEMGVWETVWGTKLVKRY